jgi:phosphoglucomutase
MISHPATGFPVGDPDASFFSPDERPSFASIRERAKSLILSASGWRKVFASDGDENSLSPAVSREDLALAALIASAFADYLVRKEGPGCRLALGIDTRPTGPRLAEVMARVFLAKGLGLSYLFIVAAPEIMAFSRTQAVLPQDSGDRVRGFCYVSASHNPPGHNGVKFGLAEGGVLSKEECEILIRDFRAGLESDAALEEAMDLARSAASRDLSQAFSGCTQWKRMAHSAYLLFTREVVTGANDLEGQDDVLDRISRSLSERPLGVLAEMNGSARCLSIDADFLSIAGLKVRLMNARPREFAHRIVPEGDSLDDCRAGLEKAHAEDKAFLLGYVPDCDGDRGNLVYMDEDSGKAHILAAQEVFALSVLAELAILEWNAEPKGKGPRPKLAVVMNDPTSMRIEEIASAFGAACIRAEVGEANVVNAAREARQKGYLVRVLGEGSNGGSIIHPSAVRDPIDTVMAAVKLLALRDEGERKGPFHRWLELSGQADSYRPDYSLKDVIASLPAYQSTSAFENKAALKIRSTDQAELKRRYEKIFRAEWEERKGELRHRFGIASWTAIAYSGTKETVDIADFGLSGSGGLKLLFKDPSGRSVAFLWMRGSGTEPVFRIMADVKRGLAEDEEYLLDWQAAMVKKADEGR